jgi:hypothetical protein
VEWHAIPGCQWIINTEQRITASGGIIVIPASQSMRLQFMEKFAAANIAANGDHQQTQKHAAFDERTSCFERFLPLIAHVGHL